MALAVLVLSLTACAGPPPPRDQYYRLAVAEPAQSFQRPPLPGIIEVDRLETDGVISERALAFQTRPGGPLGRYSYDYWSEPPGIMLQGRLVDTLRAARAAERIVTPDLRVPSDWTLRGKLRRFEQVADRVAIELQLAVVSARDGTLVLQETYAAELPAGSDKVEAAVIALGHGTTAVLNRFLADLGRAKLPERRP
jgi:cholesterol transport system auxiliary component